MKIEQLIVQHLYNTKKVSLQNIGIFYLSPNVTIPFENDKDSVMPENAISFEYNIKATQDEDLIDFIVHQTRKIKPLATSDLESFTILGSQFMNIGKPLPIEGLGILQKNQLGQYEFIQGNLINAKLEPAPALLREKDKEEIIFTTPSRKPENKTGIMLVVLVFAVLAALAVFYFLFKKNKNPQSEQLVTTSDSNRTNTLQNSIDTTATLTTVKPDSALTMKKDGFKVVIREYSNKAAADRALIRFTSFGNKVVIYPKDSVSYKLAIPFSSPLSDTLHIKDSLHRLFGGKTYIDIN